MTDDTTKAKDDAREFLDKLHAYEWPETKLGCATRLIQEVRAERDAELRRAMRVVTAALKQLEWDHRIGTDELRDTLIDQGFLDESGGRK